MSRFDDHDVVRSQAGQGSTFAEIMERRISRRAFLTGAATTSAVVLTTPALAATLAPTHPQQETVKQYVLGFETIPPQNKDFNSVLVPAAYSVQTLLRWGDPITATAPAFDPANQTAAAQEQQFGYNCDFVGFLPLTPGGNESDKGLLVVNHEYTNPEIMFAGYDPENPTQPRSRWISN